MNPAHCHHPRVAATHIQPRQALEKAMYEDLQGVTEYFGEDFAPSDATRLLRTVRDFVVLFEKGMADIKVGAALAGRGWWQVYGQYRGARPGSCVIP